MKVNSKLDLHLNTDKNIFLWKQDDHEAYPWFSPSLSIVVSQSISLFVWRQGPQLLVSNAWWSEVELM